MTGLKAEGLTNPLLQSSAVAISARVDIPFQGLILAQERYVGAQTGGSCHAEQYASQSRSNHATALHRPSNFDQLPTGPGGESAEGRFEATGAS